MPMFGIIYPASTSYSVLYSLLVYLDIGPQKFRLVLTRLHSKSNLLLELGQ